MRRLLALAACAAALLAPAAAEAHPLGNFTVNRHTTIELSGGRIYLHYALDLAEIPTLQLGKEVRRAGFAHDVASRLELRVDGRRAALRPVEQRTVQRAGAGGLKTLRFDAIYETAAAGSTLQYRDRNFGSRIGWREVVVRASEGAKLLSASVPATSESAELRAYPQDLLRSPLEVTYANARFELGSGSGRVPELDGATAAEHRGGGFEALISRGDLSLGVVLLSLLIAAFWGAAHALTPGHGKAIVAGYLVGTKGRPVDAFLLGGIVTVTHTAGVFALGFVTLLLSQFIVPESLYPWLTLVSGLLVVAVGASVLVSRFRGRGGHHHDHSHGHGHSDGHGHSHGHGHHHGHSHRHEVRTDRRGIIGVGLAAGLLPCPSALVVLLSAIALHRIGFGLALIVAFSLGLAATITSIGLVAVFAKRAFSRFSFDGPLIRLLPAASALVILAVGIGITLKALPEVL
jgi:nickel/cobalt transporter (NicO) family protein